MKRLAPAVVLLIALIAPAAHAAKPAKITGKLKGAKLPAAGEGRVPVWALRIKDGTVAATTNASRGGRFTLKPPAGSYAILATVVPAEGRRGAVHRVADFVTAKAGKHRRIKPTLKQRKRKGRRGRAAGGPGARAAWVDVAYPVLWIHKWTTTSADPELKVMEKGMQAMMITDLAAILGRPDCPGAISAGDDLPLVLAEIGLSQSRYFDESTRMTTRNLLRPNASLTGTMSRANGQLTITATYTDRTGQGGTVSVTGPEDTIFDLEQQLVPKLANLICAETPKAYAGTFNGTYKTSLNNYTVTWTGDAIIELLTERGGPPTDGPPPPDYAHYVVRSGKVRAVLDGTRGECTVHGEAEITLVPGAASGMDYVQNGVEKPWYALSIAAGGADAIPYTETGFGCNQVDPQYPLTGVQFVFTPAPLQSADGRSLTGNTSWEQFGFSSYTSGFSFTPSE